MEPTNQPTGEYLREEETIELRRERGPQDKRFSERSPEEVKQMVKEKVKRGIAGVAGALEGLNEEVEQDHLPEKTEKAVHNVGETTRKVADAAREETRQTKDSLKKTVHTVGETTRDVAGAAKEETDQTRDTLKKERGKKTPGLEEPYSGLEEPPRRF